ncbi:MAG: hypothetical protein AAGI68_09040 [Planctomycetota bacterium]
MSERHAWSPLLRREFVVGSLAFLTFLVALRVAVLGGSGVAIGVVLLAAGVMLAAVGRLIVLERRAVVVEARTPLSRTARRGEG